MSRCSGRKRRGNDAGKVVYIEPTPNYCDLSPFFSPSIEVSVQQDGAIRTRSPSIYVAR